MVDAASKVPVNTGESAQTANTPQTWQPFESLRREIDHLFENFGRQLWSPSLGSLAEPFRRAVGRGATPATDVTDTASAYQISAELPGMEDKNVSVSLANGQLTIKGEKREEKEEKRKDYYVQERHFGSYERSFRLPEDVDVEKISATFKNGVLTVTLPKTAEAQKPAKTIDVKAA
jgi:HSP20 family protein